MDPSQLTQAFDRCPGCRGIVSPADALCPHCGRGLADRIERTVQLPRIDGPDGPLGASDAVRPAPIYTVSPPPVAAPPIDRPVAYRARASRRGLPAGLLLAALLVGAGAVLYFAAARGGPMFGAPSAAPQPSAAGASSTTPVAGASNVARWVVANTGGEGVYLRRTPRLDDRLVAWPDKTTMQDLGEEANGDGLTWRKVRDPAGNVGYVPTKWLAPA